MSWNDLFIAKRRMVPSKGETVAAGEGQPATVGVFITPQSLVSFPVASTLVMIIWGLIQKLVGAPAHAPWVPVVIALVLGGIIFITSVNAPDVRPKSTGAWAVAVGIGILNSLLLAASALGVLGTNAGSSG